ncbi:MAG: hypothetical protein M0Q51_10940 [Bacteroidales bacterium]|nr:hypothetical protein [Bacteroidales bacterium]
MEKEKIIKRTVQRLRLLPDDKLKEADDYIEFLLKKYQEEVILQKGIEKMIEHSDSFKFLDNEEDLYSVSDLKEKYK